MKKILISGGAGFVGSALVPKLIEKGYKVNVFDTFWFWDSTNEFVEKLGLKDNKNLKIFKGDLRNIKDINNALEDCEIVIQLACISNDPSSDLNPKFTHSVNYDGNINIIEQAKIKGVKKFIYASSSSVYGIKDIPDVTEDIVLEPITQYSKLKVEVEHFLQHVVDDTFQGVIIRPATVCGYAPKQRLDVIVNLFTHLGLHKGKLSVFGGEQLRPNIHIDDMVDLYILLVEKENFNDINGEAFNAGWQNIKVIEIGNIVKDIVGDVEIEIVPTPPIDQRSYHISSNKMKKILGFEPKKTVKDAIFELNKAFEEGKIPDYDSDKYFNMKRMKRFLEEGIVK